MNTLAQQIQTETTNYVNKIQAIAGQAAQNALATLGLGLGLSNSGAIEVNVPRNMRGKGVKRSPAELEALTKRFLHYVQAHPGERIEAIGKALKVKTKDLLLPVKKLVASKQIVTKGSKRATEYSPAPTKTASKKRPAKKSPKAAK